MYQTHFRLFTAMQLAAVCCLFLLLLTSCWRRDKDAKEEQIVMSPNGEITTDEPANQTDSMQNAVQGNVTLSQLATKPNAVLLTGLPAHRLVTVYKSKPVPATNAERYISYSSDDGEYGSDGQERFMPGIDILYGYNLLNIAHYDMQTEKLNFLFTHPVLVKTLYYPSVTQDSLNNKPINRHYFLVSVYDEDTNKDSLINKKDLRRLYHFNENTSTKTQILPADYSAVRSQYDFQNDVMYIFTRHDANKNGSTDPVDPIHVFWIQLAAPAPAKRLY